MPLTKTILSLLNPIEAEPAHTKPKLRKLSGIRAVIFDVYGTLFTTRSGENSLDNTGAESDRSIVEALEESDFDVFEHEMNLKELYIGHVKAHYDIRKAEGILHPEINICDVWQDFLNELFANGIIDGDMTERSMRHVIVRHECKVNPVWPSRGSLEFIRNLQDTNTYSGIISTAQFYTPIMMEALYQNSLETLGFKRPICIWSYEHRHKKPSATIFKLCEEGLKIFGIKTSDVLYVGNDMLNDIIPAHRIGMKTALFTGDVHSLRLHEEVDECREIKPTIIFNAFEQLNGCVL
ncbi:MAG: HAD family hydrolase [Puniceicoccales bacterium]|jgi:putative hydrolase of the HAD superfamily|nr:HAD family hydrolase [Puniceicoccales bacterium]